LVLAQIGPEGVISFFDYGQYIAVQGTGCWSPEYLDAHFADLAGLLGRRRRDRQVLVLVDLTRAGVQSDETAERIRYWTANLYRQSDRVAIVLASSMLKAQMRRYVMVADRELFLSRTAALAWLLAKPA